MRLPQASTLFPHTTLFRSVLVPELAHADAHCVAGVIGARIRRIVIGHISRQQDRKSTRLNSSHRCISYAVLCLKKKKKSRDRTTTAEACMRVIEVKDVREG